MFWQAAVALGAGASVAFETRSGLAESVAADGISHVVLMPMLLRDLVERAGMAPPGPSRPTVVSIGGRVPPELRRRALDRVAKRLVEVYSSNEAGNIATIEGDAPGPAATVLPGVEVEIVDERGAPLPPGQEGEIRVRTPYMIDGFHGDPAATARMFKGGWFHPGDRGVLRAPERLEVLGRADELMNVGGIKVLPGDIEDVIRRGGKVSDAGVCMVRNADGIDEVWVAVCFAPGADAAAVERLRPTFRDFPFGPANLVPLNAIPRTDTGKIKRAELRRAVEEALNAGRGSRGQPAAPNRR